MNVLVLTPDRVGSTLLQRLITIYMNAHEYDKPVINLHELTNGLESYFNPIYNRKILSKPRVKQWGYHQSLETIVNLLTNADHYKTARVARYHLNNRNDPLEDRIQFYNYLNENFYIISARRENLFEHAISWCIVKVSKKLNVFTHDEKIDTFFNIYKNGITIDRSILENNLYEYKNYLKWCDDHFQIARYFEYEKDLPNIEKYIMSLDIWPNDTKKTWNQIFGIEWTDWNKCHKLISDLGSVTDVKLLEAASQNTSTAVTIKKLETGLSLADQTFLADHGTKYKAAYKGIEELVQVGALVTGVPIKLQTLAEKRKLIKNFDECVEWYNIWVDKNGIGKKYTNDELIKISNNEVTRWYHDVPKHLLLK